MDKIYQFIGRTLKLSYGEARGFGGLLIVSILALIIIFFPGIVINSDTTVDPGDIQHLDSLVSLFEHQESNEDPRELFLFDPNVISQDSLVLLGFPRSIATRVINYRSKGGKFNTKQDLAKIYGLTDQLMAKVYPFINLPDGGKSKKKNRLPEKLDINTVRADELIKVPMIGEVFAARIIKYRNSLGGFVNENQLDEVYGLSADAVQSIRSATYIHPGFIPRKISINHDDIETLKGHPYISTALAEDIIRFREINATIESEKVLVHFKSAEKSKFEKLILYLDFD